MIFLGNITEPGYYMDVSASRFGYIIHIKKAGSKLTYKWLSYIHTDYHEISKNFEDKLIKAPRIIELLYL